MRFYLANGLSDVGWGKKHLFSFIKWKTGDALILAKNEYDLVWKRDKDRLIYPGVGIWRYISNIPWPVCAVCRIHSYPGNEENPWKMSFLFVKSETSQKYLRKIIHCRNYCDGFIYVQVLHAFLNDLEICWLPARKLLLPLSIPSSLIWPSGNSIFMKCWKPCECEINKNDYT